MATKVKTATPQKVLELFETLQPSEQRQVVATLNRYLVDLLPETASLDEAIELYTADLCSLGRAAELAGVTRWEVIEALEKRGVSIPVYSELTAEEMDEQFERLEQQGML
jgi:predicted HTH domain antitoxin